MFDQYESQSDQQFSLMDLLKMDKTYLKQRIFVFNQNYEQQEKYFTIKINQINDQNKDEIMVTISDTSQEIYKNKERAHKELLIMINATLSHEIRNPLNSIVAFNMQKDILYKKILSIINDDKLS